MDGQLLLVTNVAELTAAEIVERYKALADIERGFRVLKSEIAIAPVYHRLPDRIQRHTVAIDGSTPITGVSSIDKTEAGVLAALKVGKPNLSHHRQMSLL